MTLPPAPTPIYVDIDDTLVRSVGAKRIPIPSMIALVRSLATRNVALYCWSSGGADYARESAEALGLGGCFKSYLPKPRLLLDDTAFAEWKLLALHPSECASLSADDVLERVR